MTEATPTNEETKAEFTRRLAKLLIIPLSMIFARFTGPTVSPMIAAQLADPMAEWIVNGIVVAASSLWVWYHAKKAPAPAAPAQPDPQDKGADRP